VAPLEITEETLMKVRIEIDLDKLYLDRLNEEVQNNKLSGHYHKDYKLADLIRAILEHAAKNGIRT
jgi:hypothetical protein